ncbi:3-oxoacyl-ACP reductase [Paraconexibacter antarcticus]|uniref:3-oxoacyl-ACP reductase n=1 Tax=Paraconexibacter antarcticus TaxID=2949664 RepID=A0ABY5DV00_9ACTN|nr:3-oxoacyl-ACP reductase [Paraconexibacter antarcticus]UTI65501.1 3-oxoacyl-ACP reductase [Paraconexibacter antarcticus]
MTDTYTKLANSPIGKLITNQVGLPRPTILERWSPGDATIGGRVLLGAAPGGRLAGDVATVIASFGATASTELRDDLRTAAAAAGLDAAVWNAEVPGDARFKALVFDATGITDSTQLRELHAFFHPVVRRTQPCSRVVVLGTAPEDTGSPREATAQRALEGFTRSLGKEIGGGSTVQLVYVAPGAEANLASTLRFLLSARSAYVSGQVVRVGKAAGKVPAVDLHRPLDGKVALVTGASRGIGAAIASVLARDGAHIVGLDIPPLADDLAAVTGALGGSSLTCDITAADAPQTIAAFLKEAHGTVDIVVHNAGITQDRTLARMKPERWDRVLDINLSAEERIDDVLLEEGVLAAGSRIVCVSSIAGIAGNNGQTNYGTSKAGVAGMVQALAPVLAKQRITINAVAPGFIETQMTAAVPIAIREAGRRMNSMSQGGLPVDVAEAIAWLAAPDSGGLNGNVVRVCGQSLLGA